jgi:hypothetical protein
MRPHRQPGCFTVSRLLFGPFNYFAEHEEKYGFLLIINMLPAGSTFLSR